MLESRIKTSVSQIQVLILFGQTVLCVPYHLVGVTNTLCHFYPDNGGSMFLWYVDIYLLNVMVSECRRWQQFSIFPILRRREKVFVDVCVCVCARARTSLPPHRGQVTSNSQTTTLTEEEFPLETCKSLERTKNMVMSPDRAKNQDWPCWWGPTAILLDWSTMTCLHSS
jgi:hypothetical protein